MVPGDIPLCQLLLSSGHSFSTDKIFKSKHTASVSPEAHSKKTDLITVTERSFFSVKTKVKIHNKCHLYEKQKKCALRFCLNNCITDFASLHCQAVSSRQSDYHKKADGVAEFCSLG